VKAESLDFLDSCDHSLEGEGGVYKPFDGVGSQGGIN
jgi:hypothetical protein